MAPQALRELSDEIKGNALSVARIAVQTIVCDPERGEPEPIAVVWLRTRRRPEVAAWLEGTEIQVAPPEIRTDWILLPRTPEAVVIASVSAGPTWPEHRFNLRFPADRFRRQLKAIAESGVIGLTTETPQPGPDAPPPERCVFVPVEARPLAEFLRELPPPPVV